MAAFEDQFDAVFGRAKSTARSTFCHHLCRLSMALSCGTIGGSDSYFGIFLDLSNLA